MSQFPFSSETATDETPVAQTVVPDGIESSATAGQPVAQPTVDGASTDDEASNVKAAKKPRTTKAEKATKALAVAKKKADRLSKRYDDAMKSQEPLKAQRDEALKELAHAQASPHLPGATPAGADQVPGEPDGEPADA